jgi:hypothetical protein
MQRAQALRLAHRDLAAKTSTADPLLAVSDRVDQEAHVQEES